MSKIKLALFDIDGTLTEIRAELRAKNPKHSTPNERGEQVPIAGVPEKLAQLQAEGVLIALATNRGGVAWGYNTLAVAQDLALEAAELCGIPEVAIYVCPYHAKARGTRVNREFARDDECRKPNPGMLKMAMAMAKIAPTETVFVGDRDTDEQAAANARVKFVWAEEFFGNSLRSAP
jgi:D-glycero-D-manno-heptose 1,7-bisphosphate phosphatase